MLTFRLIADAPIIILGAALLAVLYVVHRHHEEEAQCRRDVRRRPRLREGIDHAWPPPPQVSQRGRSDARRRRCHRWRANGERTTTRVQLEMPPQAMERLQRLKEHTEAASYAEVIRNALRLFEALVEEHEKGAEFSLKRADGETVAYKIFV